MFLGTTLIDATFAEAFRMRYVRVIVTAHDDYWLQGGGGEATGYASSIIGCDAEAGIERWLDPAETPDGRPGRALLAFGFSAESLGKAIVARTGQCLMTCPSTAVYDGLPARPSACRSGGCCDSSATGIRRASSSTAAAIGEFPVMDGEFLVEQSLGVEKGIGGGNHAHPRPQARGDARRRPPRSRGDRAASRERSRRFPAASLAAAARSARAIRV